MATIKGLPGNRDCTSNNFGVYLLTDTSGRSIKVYRDTSSDTKSWRVAGAPAGADYAGHNKEDVVNRASLLCDRFCASI